MTSLRQIKTFSCVLIVMIYFIDMACLTQSSPEKGPNILQAKRQPRLGRFPRTINMDYSALTPKPNQFPRQDSLQSGSEPKILTKITQAIPLSIAEPDILHVFMKAGNYGSCNDAKLTNSCVLIFGYGNAVPKITIEPLGNENCPGIRFQLNQQIVEDKVASFSLTKNCPTKNCTFKLTAQNSIQTSVSDFRISVYPDIKAISGCPQFLNVTERGASYLCDLETRLHCNKEVNYQVIPIHIKGPESKNYIALKETGKIYARGDVAFDNKEMKDGLTHLITSRNYSSWPTTEINTRLSYHINPEPSTVKAVIEASHTIRRVGESITLACSDSIGSDIKHVTWSISSTNGSDVGNEMKQLRGQVVTLHGLDLTQSGYYRCHFSDKNGNQHVSSPFELIIIGFDTRCNRESFSYNLNSSYLKGMLDLGNGEAEGPLVLYANAMLRKLQHTIREFAEYTISVLNMTPKKSSTTMFIAIDQERRDCCTRYISDTLKRNVNVTDLPELLFDARNYLNGKVVKTRNGPDGIQFSYNNNVLKLVATFESCREHRKTLYFEWTFYEAVIRTDNGHSSFVTYHNVTKETKAVICTIERVNATLEINGFRDAFYGNYSCTMKVAYGQRLLPWTVTATRQIDKDDKHIFLQMQPKADIYPKDAYVLHGTKCNLSCDAVNGVSMEFSVTYPEPNVTGKVVELPFIQLGNQQKVTKEVTFLAPKSGAPGSNPIMVVSCIVKGIGTEMKDESKARIWLKSTLQDKDKVDCNDSMDEYDTIWPTSAGDTNITMPCPSGYDGFITRQCTIEGAWKKPSYINCRRKDLTDVYSTIEMLTSNNIQPSEELVESIADRLSSSIEEYKPRLTGDLRSLTDSIDQISDATLNYEKADKEKVLINSKAIEKFSNVANRLLSTNKTVWKALNEEETEIKEVEDGESGNKKRKKAVNSASKLLVAMDHLAKSSLRDSDFSNRPIVKDNIVIKREDMSSAEDINFPDKKDNKFYDVHNKWVLNTKSKVHLPAEAFNTEQGKDIHYAVILYKNVGELLDLSMMAAGEPNLERSEIGSEILSFSINIEITDLSSDLHLQFTPSMLIKGQPQCVYLDTEVNSGMVWTNKHCRTEVDATGQVNCYCNHLTNFAVLMRPAEGQVKDEVLNTISIIGCAVSIICLVLTLLVYGLSWTHVHGTRSILHVCLSSFLLLAYLLFLVGVQRTENNAGCLVVTIMLHYVLLVCFSIMLTEGVELFVRIKFIFSQKSLGWKFFAPVFLAPLLIVGITVGATWDRGYRSPHFCWLNIESGAMWSFFVPIIAVILTNFVIAVFVFRAMLSTHAMINLENKNKAKAVLKAVCVITPLLGFTWIIGLVSISEDAIVFDYLFAICNSLQGVFIFVFHCLLSKQIQDGVKLRLRVLRSRYLTTTSSGGGTATTGRSRVKSNDDDNMIELKK